MRTAALRPMCVADTSDCTQRQEGAEEFGSEGLTSPDSVIEGSAGRPRNGVSHPGLCGPKDWTLSLHLTLPEASDCPAVTGGGTS